MSSNMINFPYNSLGVARMDEYGIIHNHLYHECPVGRVDTDNIIHNHHVNYSPIGRVDKDGIIHKHISDNYPIGRVDNNGFVYDNKNNPIARVEGDDIYKSGGGFLLLIIFILSFQKTNLIIWDQFFSLSGQKNNLN